MYSQPCGAPQPEPCKVLKSVHCAEVSIEGLTKATIVCCIPILHKIPTQIPVTSISLILTLLLEINNSQWFQFKQTYTAVQVSHLTLRRLMSYIYGAPILDVSRSHTTTQHSR